MTPVLYKSAPLKPLEFGIQPSPDSPSSVSSFETPSLVLGNKGGYAASVASLYSAFYHLNKGPRSHCLHGNAKK